MNLKVQKNIAAKVLKCSPQRVMFATDKLATIKEALTRADIRDLINSNIITVKPIVNTSRGRARHIHAQKVKGLRVGVGSRKGTPNARLNIKEAWATKMRNMRPFISQLRANGRISTSVYRNLYGKVKGNYFRNRQHIILYLEENNLFEARANKSVPTKSSVKSE